jgi:hypothetical protein
VSKKITLKKRMPSAEAKAMDKAFKLAAKRASKSAFAVRKTIMVEKDGWLVMVNKDGRVTRRVKKLEPVQLPK